MRPLMTYLFAILSPMIVGCGGGPKDAPETVGVSGTVTLDGQPLTDAIVLFVPVDPATGTRMVSGRTDSSGEYDLNLTSNTSGAPPGDYKVQITTAEEDEDGNYKTEKVPTVYNSDTSLTASVPDGSFDFDLKSDAGEISQPSAEDYEGEVE